MRFTMRWRMSTTSGCVWLSGESPKAASALVTVAPLTVYEIGHGEDRH